MSTTQVWYCPSCGFGPLNPYIDAACPNCGWYKKTAAGPLLSFSANCSDECASSNTQQPDSSCHHLSTKLSTTVVWYCPSCKFGPLNPFTDAACPNCGWYKSLRGPARLPAESSTVLPGTNTDHTAGARIAFHTAPGSVNYSSVFETQAESWCNI